MVSYNGPTNKTTRKARSRLRAESKTKRKRNHLRRNRIPRIHHRPLQRSHPPRCTPKPKSRYPRTLPILLQARTKTPNRKIPRHLQLPSQKRTKIHQYQHNLKHARTLKLRPQKSHSKKKNHTPNHNLHRKRKTKNPPKHRRIPLPRPRPRSRNVPNRLRELRLRCMPPRLEKNRKTNKQSSIQIQKRKISPPARRRSRLKIPNPRRQSQIRFRRRKYPNGRNLHGANPRIPKRLDKIRLPCNRILNRSNRHLPKIPRRKSNRSNRIKKPRLPKRNVSNRRKRILRRRIRNRHEPKNKQVHKKSFIR